MECLTISSSKQSGKEILFDVLESDVDDSAGIDADGLLEPSYALHHFRDLSRLFDLLVRIATRLGYNVHFHEFLKFYSYLVSPLHELPKE